MNVCGCQGRKRMTATLSLGQGIWLFIAPVFPLSTGDNPFILRIRRSPRAPRFRHQSIITLLMLFRSTTFKSLKAGKVLGKGIGVDEPVKHVSKERGIVDLMLSRAIRRHRADDLIHL